MAQKYQPNDYLGGFICPDCEKVDCLYYTDCPACEENFVKCARCRYKSSMENCTAVMFEEEK